MLYKGIENTVKEQCCFDKRFTPPLPKKWILRKFQLQNCQIKVIFVLKICYIVWLCISIDNVGHKGKVRIDYVAPLLYKENCTLIVINIEKSFTFILVELYFNIYYSLNE